MERVLIGIFGLGLAASCGSNDSASSGGAKKHSAATARATTDLISNPVYQKGLAIEASSNFATCHKIDEKVQGPSYQDIATKYAGLPDTIVTHLAKKIRSGGTGVWGDILMMPHLEI